MDSESVRVGSDHVRPFAKLLRKRTTSPHLRSRGQKVDLDEGGDGAASRVHHVLLKDLLIDEKSGTIAVGGCPPAGYPVFLESHQVWRFGPSRHPEALPREKCSLDPRPDDSNYQGAV